MVYFSGTYQRESKRKRGHHTLGFGRCETETPLFIFLFINKKNVFPIATVLPSTPECFAVHTRAYAMLIMHDNIALDCVVTNVEQRATYTNSGIKHWRLHCDYPSISSGKLSSCTNSQSRERLMDTSRKPLQAVRDWEIRNLEKPTSFEDNGEQFEREYIALASRGGS